jgi:hypothetical protein
VEDAGGLSPTGTGATSQTKAVDLAQRRHHPPALEQHRGRAGHEAVLVAEGEHLGLGRHDLVDETEVDEPLDARRGPRRVDRQRCRVVGVVDQLAPGLPDERGEPDQAVLDAEAVEVGQAVAVSVSVSAWAPRGSRPSPSRAPAAAPRPASNRSGCSRRRGWRGSAAGKRARRSGERRQRLREVGREVEPGRLERRPTGVRTSAPRTARSVGS